MPVPAEQHRKTQVIEVLKQRYFHIIPEKPGGNPSDREINRLSRSLAAFAIQKLANCSDVDAAFAVIDCGSDNGIDAIYYDRRQHTLWLVQSKYGDAPNRPENQTFCSGIEDLLAERYDRFHLLSYNSEFDRIQADVEEALQTTATKVIACVVYMEKALGPHAIADLDRLKVEQNENKLWFNWRDIGLSILHTWLIEEHAIATLNVELQLEQWNILLTPRRAVYGMVKASHLAQLYIQHGNTLFEKNIRYYLGNEAVNIAIAQTVQQQPTELFFLNNGLTIICTEFAYTGNNKVHSRFTLSSFSIVNGAQTVGSIAMASQIGTIADDAKLLVTIIEVGQGSSATELGKRITRTRNTQNVVHRDNFAALDPNQERLRQELAVSGITYHYRTSADTILNDNTQFSLKDATCALACFYRDIQAIVLAKKEISLVYDSNGPFYSNLFRNSLSGTQLYRQVQIYRYIDTILASAEATEDKDKRQKFFRHGRYFILHLWARHNQAMLNKAQLILSDEDQLQLSYDILDLAEQIYTTAEAIFATGQKGFLKIFRTMTDVVQLAQAVEATRKKEN